MKRVVRLGKEFVLWKYKLATEYQGKDRVALASFPRSGNTWARILIESATGQQTGSIYNDRVFQRGRNGIVIKTHSRDSFKYNKAIILVRNPLDAFASHYKWRKSFERHNKVVEREEHINRCISMWKNFYTHWSGLRYPNLVINFENLKSETENNLKSIIDFLEKDISANVIKEAIEESEISKMRNDKESGSFGGNFFNSGKSNVGRTFFTTAELVKIQKGIGKIAEKHGYVIE